MLSGEAAATLVTGAIANLFVSRVAAVAFGLLVLCALLCWRYLDNDRSDYFFIWARQKFSTVRHYNMNEKDPSYEVFKGLDEP